MAATPEAFGQVTTSGSEIPVGVTAAFQGAPAIAGDGVGDFLVAWQRQSAASGGTDIYARRYHGGTAAGAEFQVNSTTGAGCRSQPAVASDAAGDVVVIWRSDQESGGVTGIFGQLFNGAGAAVGGQFQVNTTTTYADAAPAVAMAPGGAFFVTWQADEGSGWSVVGRAYAAGGMSPSNEIAVNVTTVGAQHSPAVAWLATAASGGAYEVVWQAQGRDASEPGASAIVGRSFNGAGNALSGELEINAPASGSHGHPRIAADPSGNFTVVWENATATASAVLARRFTAAGVPLSAPLIVDANAAGSPRNPAVATDEVGHFVVVWDRLGEDGSGAGVLAQELDNNEKTLGGQVQLNTTTAGDQEMAVVSTGSGGELLSAWQSVAPGATGSVVTGLLAKVPALSFYTLAPCRLVDTRQVVMPLGGPALASGMVRNFPLANACGLPQTAKAVSLNVTVVTPSGSGYAQVFPGDAPVPPTSTINFAAGAVLANNCVIGLSRAGDGSLNVLATVAGSPGTTHFLIDINGFFE